MTGKLNLSSPTFVTSLGFLPLDHKACKQKGRSALACLLPAPPAVSQAAGILTGEGPDWQKGSLTGWPGGPDCLAETECESQRPGESLQDACFVPDFRKGSWKMSLFHMTPSRRQDFVSLPITASPEYTLLAPL